MGLRQEGCACCKQRQRQLPADDFYRTISCNDRIVNHLVKDGCTLTMPCADSIMERKREGGAVKRIRLGEAGIEKNGFGCFSIQRISGEGAADLLRKAHDGEIGFFDTARGYSDGEEETDYAFRTAVRPSRGRRPIRGSTRRCGFRSATCPASRSGCCLHAAAVY